jgi:hypothetical protein
MAPSCASRTAIGAPGLASRSADLSARRKMPSTALASSGVWCRKGRSGSPAPPTWGPPSPWGRGPAPRRGRSPGDAAPPGRGASRWDGGGDRRALFDGPGLLAVHRAQVEEPSGGCVAHGRVNGARVRGAPHRSPGCPHTRPSPRRARPRSVPGVRPRSPILQEPRNHEDLGGPVATWRHVPGTSALTPPGTRPV